MRFWRDHKGMKPRRIFGIFSVLACWELDGCCSLYLGLDFWLFGFGIRNHFHAPPFDYVHSVEKSTPGYGKAYRSRGILFKAWVRRPWKAQDFDTDTMRRWLVRGISVDIPHPWRYAV